MKKASKGTQRSLAALNLPRSVPVIVTYAQVIVGAMTDNPHFPAPVPALWLLSKAIQDLLNAEATARTRAQGAAAIRDEKRTMVGSLVQQRRSYVQVTADSDPENGGAIIASAGMTVKRPGHRSRRAFSAKPGALSGEIKIVAPRGSDRASYDWEYSTDAGVNWLAMPSTLQASTRLQGLTPGTSVMLKYRTVTRRGVSDWSAAITVAVK